MSNRAIRLHAVSMTAKPSQAVPADLMLVWLPVHAQIICLCRGGNSFSQREAMA